MTYLGRQKPWEGVNAEDLLNLHLLISNFLFHLNFEPGRFCCLSNLNSASFL